MIRLEDNMNSTLILFTDLIKVIVFVKHDSSLKDFHKKKRFVFISCNQNITT